MRLLRKDTPTHLLCDYCQKFHPKPEVGRGEKRLVCPSSEKTSWLSWPEFDVCLQFENVQMVMNRHCWGEAHGAPLNSLSLHTPWKFVNNQQGTLFLAKFDMEPKIVDGRLILRTTQRAFFTKDQARITTVDFVRDSANLFKVCKHKMTRCLELNLAFLMNESDSDLKKDQTYRSKLFVCSRCSVFHDISILENGLFEEATRADAGMEFVLRTWMDLGQCEHTFSPLWLSAAEHSHPYPATTCKKAEKITRKEFDKVIGDVKASKSKESHGAITLSAIEGALAKIAEEDEQLSQQNHEHMKIIAENGPIATALGYRVSSKVAEPTKPSRRCWGQIKQCLRSKIRRLLRKHNRHRAQKEIQSEDYMERYSTLV